MPARNSNSPSFIEFIGSMYVEGFQLCEYEASGNWGRTMANAKPTDKFRWKFACEDGFMVVLGCEIIHVSKRRRMNHGHNGLLEEACEALLHSRFDQYLRQTRQVSAPNLKAKFYLAKELQRFAEQYGPMHNLLKGLLTRKRNKIFSEDLYVVVDGPSKMTAHPMQTFVEWLDELDHIKSVDPVRYKQQYKMKRDIVAYHRVGLAFLPPATWGPFEELSDEFLQFEQKLMAKASTKSDWPNS